MASNRKGKIDDTITAVFLNVMSVLSKAAFQPVIKKYFIIMTSMFQ